MKPLSLKTKATLLFPLAVTLVLAAILFGTHFLLQTYIKNSISNQQYQVLTILADAIDRTIADHHHTLTLISSRINRTLLADPQKALAYLQEQSEHLHAFDNGLFLFDAQGRMIAELPLELQRSGKDFSYREYFKHTLSTRKPFLSDPYVSSKKHHPAAIMFTAPVLDQDGAVMGVLGGSIDLTNFAFIEKLSRIKLSKGAYLYLFNKERMLISHPDPSRVMKQDVPPGKNRLFDRAIDGFDGTGETITSRGMHTLSSFKHLTTKDWILAANYPISEAYAPIYKLRVSFALLLPLLSLATFFFSRYFLRKFVYPVVTLTKHIEDFNQGGINSLPVPADGYDEIATLAQSFNSLINEIELKKNELAHREKKFRLFFNNSSDAIFVIAMDGLIIEANQEACQRYGFRYDELVGMPVTEFDTPEQAPHVQERIDKITADGHYTFTTEHRRNNAAPLKVEVSASLIEFESSRAILAVARDLTERDRASGLLHRQNEYLMALHETTLGLISRLDVTNLLQAIVSRAGQLVGTEHCFLYLKNSSGSAMDMVFQSGIYDSLIHHPILPGQGIAGRVWLTGEAIHVDDYCHWEGRLPDPDRDVLHAMAGVPLKNGNEVVGVLGLAFIDEKLLFDAEQLALLNQFGELASLALDNARLYDAAQRELAERTKAEEQLRKLSHVVEQSPVSIVITDLQGTIEYANQHFIELTGYSLEELQGKNPRVLKTGTTSQEEYKALWDTIQSGHEWRGEFQNIKKNGDLYWELALIAPIRDSNGDITHYMAIKEDITERKRMENQLRHSQKMEAIGQLAGGIAHDFNNILTAIIGYTTILQMKIPEDSPLKPTTDQVLASAERGSALTQGLLAFSRKEANNPNRIDFNGVLQRVEKLLVRLIGEDIHLSVQPYAQPLLILADSMQMEQVLMNLATNARDAMPDGGDLTITTEPVELDAHFIASHGFGKTGRYVLMTVSDTGHGMDTETVKHIFEPFYTTKATGKGTGLGLSIVYGIIKKHTGFITCHSLEGIGTVFHIYLPLTEGGEAEEIAPHSAPVSFQPGSETILLAEDDAPTRELAKELLEEFGYRVIEARDGKQASELFHKMANEIRLVILDALMPKMKGMDVYRVIRERDSDVRVIICSGYTADIMEGSECSDPHLHFIAKPFMPKELLMKIREVLEDAD